MKNIPDKNQLQGHTTICFLSLPSVSVMSMTRLTCEKDISSTCLYVGLLPLSMTPRCGWRLIVLTSLLNVFPLDRRLQICRSDVEINTIIIQFIFIEIKLMGQCLTSITSEKRNRVNCPPRPTIPSPNSITSHWETKLRCEETIWAW